MRILAEGRIRKFFPELSTAKKREKMGLTAKWLSWNGESYGLGPRARDRNFVVAEMDPCVRRIRWAGKSKEDYSYLWQMPRLILMYCEGFLGVAVTNDKEWKPTSVLHLPPLPNVYSTGKVCQSRAKDLEEAVAILFGSYFDVPLRWWQMDYLNNQLYKVPSLHGETQYGRGWNDRFSKFYEKHPEMVLNYQWPEALALGDSHRFRGMMIPFIQHIAAGDLC
jgi:hypothetical protein